MGQNVVAVVVQVGLLLWASRFIDFADPSMLYYLRIGYLVSVGFSMLMFTRVYAKLSQLAAQRGQEEVKKWFVVDQTMFQTAPRVIHRTELEHELAEFWNRMSQLAMQIGIVMFLHLYIGSAEAVLIQGAMNVTECISHTLVQKHVFGRSLENAWGATDEKPEGAVEVMLEGDVATQAAQQDAALASGVNLDDTSQSTTTASTATPDRYFHPLPELVLNDTRAKLDKCVLDAWNRNPDREADEICSDIRSFLDVVKSVETDIDAEAANACVNYQTEEGWSMLMVAAGQAKTAQVQDMVTSLIAAGAEPTTHDGDGETCLDWAVNHRNVAAVKSLVECLHRQSNDACDNADEADADVTAAADSLRNKCVEDALRGAETQLQKVNDDIAASTGQQGTEDTKEEIDHVQASELQKRKSDLEVIVEFLSRHDGTGPKLTSKTTDKDGPSNP